jgi:hypothetical protein
MQKLKLSAIPDDKPVKLTVELPAAVHRDLVAYAEVLGGETGHAVEPAKLVAPMLARAPNRFKDSGGSEQASPDVIAKSR